MPELEKDFQFTEEEIMATQNPDKRASLIFKGGEKAGLKRLEYYCTIVNNYADTRNDLMGADYSSKFSPWLANGSLSVKQIYHQI